MSGPNTGVGGGLLYIYSTTLAFGEYVIVQDAILHDDVIISQYIFEDNTFHIFGYFVYAANFVQTHQIFDNNLDIIYQTNFIDNLHYAKCGFPIF